LSRTLEETSPSDAAPAASIRPTVPAGRGHNRELYIDAFRGLMALVMVQGHVCDSLLSPAARAHDLYQLQTVFHGSTAPGFLFASGFVAGLPRSPLSLSATVRRARRLLFVLGVGYALHLPYFSLWKTAAASPGQHAVFYACDALQAIAVTQLVVLAVQWAVGRRWTQVTGALAIVILAAGPFVWAGRVAERWPPALGAYLDVTTGSHFPLFPFAVFVLAGTVAGAVIGRQEPGRRHRRAVFGGLALIGVGLVLAYLLAGRVDFWGVSPAYTLIRIGGLLMLLFAVEAWTARERPGSRAIALLGRETLLVFVLHLQLLYGGVLVTGPLSGLMGRLEFPQAGAILVLMVPVLYAAAWAWHRVKVRAPHEATLVLVFSGTAFVFEFLTRPW
jgi:fucose 4-O-acetylase-like acetyltransferase